MRHIASMAALWAVAFWSAGYALADDHENRSNRDEQTQRGDREDRREGDARASEREREGERRGADRQHDEGRSSVGERRDERGAGPDHAFHRGGTLPDRDHDRRYVVEDWRGHHLSEPPRGYHWVQTGSDFVLVAIASGIILQLLLSN